MNDKFLQDFYRYKKKTFSYKEIKTILCSYELQYVYSGRKMQEGGCFYKFWRIFHKILGRKMGNEIDNFSKIGGALS